MTVVEDAVGGEVENPVARKPAAGHHLTAGVEADRDEALRGRNHCRKNLGLAPAGGQALEARQAQVTGGAGDRLLLAAGRKIRRPARGPRLAGRREPRIVAVKHWVGDHRQGLLGPPPPCLALPDLV